MRPGITNPIRALTPAQGALSRGEHRRGLHPEGPTRVTQLVPIPRASDRQDGAERRLREHLSKVEAALREGRQPDLRILEGDLDCLGDLIDAENRRDPRLGLATFTSARKLADAMRKRSGPARARVILRMAEASLHHIYADVARSQDGQLSVVLVEPGGLGREDFASLYVETILALREAAGRQAPRISVVDANTQRNRHDNVIFDLVFALQAARHQDVFDLWHRRHFSGARICPHAPHPLAAILDRFGIDAYDGRYILPPEFFFHTHSRSVIDSVLRVRTEWQTGPVGEHLRACRDQLRWRLTIDGMRQILPAIEYMRASLLRRALGIAVSPLSRQGLGKGIWTLTLPGRRPPKQPVRDLRHPTPPLTPVAPVMRAQYDADRQSGEHRQPAAKPDGAGVPHSPLSLVAAPAGAASLASPSPLVPHTFRRRELKPGVVSRSAAVIRT